MRIEFTEEQLANVEDGKEYLLTAILKRGPLGIFTCLKVVKLERLFSEEEADII